MKRSTSRILTTHTGSLPRPSVLLGLLRERDQGRPVDDAAFQTEVRKAVSDIVKKQTEVGIDVVNDGEQGKSDYTTYLKDRVAGFGFVEGDATKKLFSSMGSRESRDFPEFIAENLSGLASFFTTRPLCIGKLAWKDFGAVQTEIDDLKAAVQASSAEEVFATAPSPGQTARFLRNLYYPSEAAYIQSLGEILKKEYEAITNAGLILQIDSPDLASAWNQLSELTLPEFQKRVEEHVEVLNEATKNIDPERMRLHVCWGNISAPHNHDIPLKEIIKLVLKARPAGLMFEGANPRHEHEWKVFKGLKLPAGKVIIPGVIDSTTNYVEHPELVAERIGRYANVLGRENVIAGVDCGFATTAEHPQVHPTIAWAKLGSLVEGARIASKELW